MNLFTEMDRITGAWNDAINKLDPDFNLKAEEDKQAKIDEMVETMLKDDDECERVIAENSDVVWKIIKSGTDIQVKLQESIRHWIENDAEKFYE